jgi:hypothetical protein
MGHTRGGYVYAYNVCEVRHTIRMTNKNRGRLCGYTVSLMDGTASLANSTTTLARLTFQSMLKVMALNPRTKYDSSCPRVVLKHRKFNTFHAQYTTAI